MAIGVTLGVNTGSTSNVTSYASGSFTPAANDGLIAFVVAGATVAAGSMTDSQQSKSWTKIIQTLFQSDGSSLYVFLGPVLFSNSSMTVTFDCTGDAANGAYIYVARLTGFDTTPPGIRQAKGTSGTAGGTPAVTMDFAFNTNNCGLAIAGNGANPAALTPPTNWTETNGIDAGYGTPATGAQFCNRVSGETGSTITYGATSGTDWGLAVIEVYASGQGPIVLDNIGQSGFFGVSGTV